MNCRTAFLLVAVLFGSGFGSPAKVFAQTPAPPGPRQPARPQPAVDPLTASIQGRVTTADSGAPIRRAEVRAMAKTGISRLATTDSDGRFDLRDMPAGEYRLTVSKSGFVPLTYGQRRPFETARTIDLKQGQRIVANMTLPRGGAITGRVYDSAAEPIPSVRVQALRLRTTEGRRRFEPVGPVDLTDDTGAFRIYGLPPGDYYITASVPRAQATMPMGAPLVRPPTAADIKSTMTTFYPGTPSLEDALRVTIAGGTEARADIQIADVRMAVVSGIVLSSSGAPAPTATVNLRSGIVAMGYSGFQPGGPPPLMITGHTNPDGTFMLPNVPPGPYTLSVTVTDVIPLQVVRTTTGAVGVVDANGRVQPLGPNLPGVPLGLPPQMGSMPLVVSGADVTGLTITAGVGGTVEGTFAADAGVRQPLPRGLEVSTRVVNGSDNQMRMTGGEGFRLMGLNDITYLMVEGMPDGWAVKSMLVDGVDMTDQPLDLRGGRSVSVRFVLTDRVPVVTGKVIDEPSRDPLARANHNVVVFPEDAKKWTYPSRHVRMVRTDDQGAFRVNGLPGDERYLAIALDFLEEGEWTDPEFLEQVRARASSFPLGETEQKTIELRVVAR
jgi:hypothetical protein